MFQEVERERDRERLESKRKLDGMKGAFEEEQEDTKKQITDLQVWNFIEKRLTFNCSLNMINGLFSGHFWPLLKWTRFL